MTHSRIQRAPLGVATALLAVGVWLTASAAAAQMKTFCSEPVTPFCVNRGEVFESDMAKERCAQEVKSYVAGLEEFVACLGEQQREAQGRARDLQARFECMARGEQDCR